MVKMEEFVIFLWFVKTRLALWGFGSTLFMRWKLGSITQIHQSLWTLWISFTAEKSLRKATRRKFRWDSTRKCEYWFNHFWQADLWHNYTQSELFTNYFLAIVDKSKFLWFHKYTYKQITLERKKSFSISMQSMREKQV